MDLHTLTATEMARALAEGALRSVDLVEALQARADAVEPLVGAFTEQHREAALAAAREADRERAAGRVRSLLHGVPVTVKENLAMRGTPQTLGVRARLARPASRDAGVVAALREVGAVVLGKTNVPQLLLAMESHNEVFGTTRNPWDPARSPGGSSGGEAAAVAAGLSPLGVGTDIGGSIRMPAAWCGVVGLKPTWGRWSVDGSATAMPGQEAIRAQTGPLARTVEDLALACAALSPELQHGLDPAVPPLPWPSHHDVPLAGLRVGVYEDDGVLTPAASVRRAVREAAAHLEAAGATVVPYAPPAGWEMFDTYFGLLSADGFRTGAATLEGEPFTPQLRTIGRTGMLPAAVRRALATGAGVTGERRAQRLLRALGVKTVQQTWRLVDARNRLRREELAAWAALGLDVVIGPPTVTPAALRDETHDWSVGAWHTMRYNLLDLPAGVVPVTTVRQDEQVRAERADRLDRKAARFEEGSAGLPVAVQVIGRPWEEHRVLAAMAAIERGARSDPGWPSTPVAPR